MLPPRTWARALVRSRRVSVSSAPSSSSARPPALRTTPLLVGRRLAAAAGPCPPTPIHTRPHGTMATPAAANPFTQAVVAAMRRLYPEELADRAWDNVGLLLENTADAVPGGARRQGAVVLLTNDLTPEVVDEALAAHASVIVSYHPIIFRGLKALTLQDAQQTSLLRLMQHNVAVYCPHTALDAGAGGINDWLADAVAAAGAALGATPAPATSVQPVAGPLPAGYPPAAGAAGQPSPVVGYGRLVRFRDGGAPLPADRLIRGILGALRVPQTHVLVARPQSPTSAPIRGVAVCAGAGFGVLGGCDARDAQMLVTGEVSHHDALRAATRGQWVVCLLHSNSERQFLRDRLQPQLAQALAEADTGLPDIQVRVSTRDRDPFEIWDVANPPADGR